MLYSVNQDEHRKEIAAMMKSINTTEKLFSKENAIKTAAEMKSGDPDWDYTPVHCPKGTGYSFIEIHDEDGEFVGKV